MCCLGGWWWGGEGGRGKEFRDSDTYTSLNIFLLQCHIVPLLFLIFVGCQTVCMTTLNIIFVTRLMVLNVDGILIDFFGIAINIEVGRTSP